MPTKQWYLDNHESAKSMLDHAVANDSADEDLDFIKFSGGLVHVRLHELGNASNFADGSGPDKREAMADALAAFTA